MGYLWRGALISLAVVGITACEGNTKLQFMPDMADSPTVKAQEDYLDPPEGSVPILGVIYPETAEETEQVLTSPYTGGRITPDKLADGKKLYNDFCAMCHGEDGKGNGPVTDKFPPPPDLTSEVIQKRGDGYFFHRITFGSVMMPSYGHATDVDERWLIIAYLRTLK